MTVFDSPSVLSAAQVAVVFDGTMTTPAARSAEGLAFDRDRVLYCGGERGQIYRLSLPDRQFEQIGSTDGFCLGMASTGPVGFSSAIRGMEPCCDLIRAPGK